MKILVLTPALKEQHKEKISETAERFNAKVCFAEAEDSIPQEFKEPDILYGFSPDMARKLYDYGLTPIEPDLVTLKPYILKG